jgi:very-short-patch-repair endonuclease
MRNTEFARELRHHQTDAERKLWGRMRNRQIDGWKFRRQVPYGPYVLDFFCFEADLVIEVDGGQHAEERAAQDRERTQYLEDQGLHVIRFWNCDVLQEIDSVIEAIYAALGQKPAPTTGAQKRQRTPG